MSYAKVLLLTIALATHVFADGMPIENGRFVGGCVTVIDLTLPQIVALHAPECFGGSSVIKLSESQRGRLKAESGMAPLGLCIYNIRIGENDCTCEAVNRGLWFTEGKIEIPHGYLDETFLMPLPQYQCLSIVITACLVVCLCLVGVLLRKRLGGAHRPTVPGDA